MPVTKKTSSPAKKRTAKPVAKTAAKVQIPRFAIRTIKIDKHTTKRMDVEVDDATCEVCGYNVFIVNGDKLPFASLEVADETQKQLILTILGKHMELHSTHDMAVARVKSDAIARKRVPWLFDDEGE